MIKLLRNLLGDYKVLHTDNNGNRERIEWQYLEQLCSLQEDLGFSLANKLKRKHVLYKKHKMSVSLAAQTFSASVADALDFLRVNMAGPDIFNNVDNHFFDHHIGQERDHLTSLLRLVVKRYLNLRLKIYGKKYTEMIAHKNLPSSRHELTKTILFLNQ